MRRSLFWLSLAVIGAVSALTAAAIPIDEDPVEGDSWSQAWQESVGTFDRIEFRMTSFGDAFEAVKQRSGTAPNFAWTVTPALKNFKIGTVAAPGWAVSEERPIDWTAVAWTGSGVNRTPTKYLASPTYLELEGTTLTPDPKRASTWLNYTIVFFGSKANSLSFEEISWNGNQINQWETYNWNGSKWSWVKHDLTKETAPNLPDGGLTVALLGIGFAGLAGLRRKLRA